MGNKFSDTCIFLTSYGFFDFRFGSCTRSDTFEGRGLVEAEVSLSKGQSSKRKQNGVKWGNFMRTISSCVMKTKHANPIIIFKTMLPYIPGYKPESRKYK